MVQALVDTMPFYMCFCYYLDVDGFLSANLSFAQTLLAGFLFNSLRSELLLLETTNQEKPKSQMGFKLTTDDISKFKLKKTGNLPKHDTEEKSSRKPEEPVDNVPSKLPDPIKPPEPINHWDPPVEPKKESPVEQVRYIFLLICAFSKSIIKRQKQRFAKHGQQYRSGFQILILRSFLKVTIKFVEEEGEGDVVYQNSIFYFGITDRKKNSNSCPSLLGFHTNNSVSSFIVKLSRSKIW